MLVGNSIIGLNLKLLDEQESISCCCFIYMNKQAVFTVRVDDFVPFEMPSLPETECRVMELLAGVTE